MFDNKFIITLITLIIGIIAICNFNKKDDQLIEDFGMLPNFVRVPSLGTMNPKTNQFVSHPSFQPMLSPRMFSEHYGANITYNLPAHEHLAVPRTPLSGGACGIDNSVIESYLPPTCNNNPANVVPPIDSSGGNYNEPVSNVLPVGTMEMAGTDGESANVVVYNHLMYANRNERLRGMGDPIRGDLVVCCATGKDAAWVPSVSLTPLQALQTGAMNVMGGIDNNNSKDLAVLNNNSIGSTVSGGVNIGASELLSLGANQTNVDVVAYA